MSESRRATHRSSAEVSIKSDLAKIDAHVIAAEEYDEIPELTDEMIRRADVYVGDRFVRHGAVETPDAPVSIQLLPGIADHFRAQGPGWQARVNAILMEIVDRERMRR